MVGQAGNVLGGAMSAMSNVASTSASALSGAVKQTVQATNQVR